MATQTLGISLDKANVVTTTGNSSGSASGSNVTNVSVFVSVSAVGGTSPSLTPQLQAKDVNGDWFNVGSALAALTANGSDVSLNIAGPFPANGNVSQFRLAYTVSGTTPTFTVDASITLQYGAPSTSS
jgi:hypothetical protein